MLFYFVFIFAVISLISGIMLNKEELSLHSRVLIITVSIILIVADASVAVYLGTTDLDKSNYYNKYYKEKERIKAENIKIVEEKKNSKSDDTSLSSSAFNCIITFTDEYSIERSIEAKRNNISISDGSENIIIKKELDLPDIELIINPFSFFNAKTKYEIIKTSEE